MCCALLPGNHSLLPWVLHMRQRPSRAGLRTTFTMRSTCVCTERRKCVVHAFVHAVHDACSGFEIQIRQYLKRKWRNDRNERNEQTRIDAPRSRRLTCRTHTRDGRVMKHGNDPSVMPGDETTFQSYGVGWANLSNAPSPFMLSNNLF